MASANKARRTGPKPRTRAARKPKGTGLHRNLVEKEILDQAATLFAERGFAGTTLQDLADTLGMSRPSLYYYVRSKEALVERLVENLSQRDASALEAIRRSRGTTAAEKLRKMARELAMNAASNPQQSRILSVNRHHLPKKLAEEVRALERTILRNLQAVIEDGAQRGEFRSVDPATAALAIIGMCIWTAWWVDRLAPALIERVTAEIADQAVSSVLALDPRGERNDPKTLLDVVREDLNQLERLI